MEVVILVYIFLYLSIFQTIYCYNSNITPQQFVVCIHSRILSHSSGDLFSQKDTIANNEIGTFKMISGNATRGIYGNLRCGGSQPSSI